MPRSARVVLPGFPHHVTQRGNNRQDVFFSESDRRQYLKILREQSHKHGLSIDAYCPMTNHIHLVVTPATAESLGEMMRRLGQFYAQYINDQYNRSGHLWQDRFFSCGLDELHYWSAMIYVERNPVRAGLIGNAWEWPWSSAAAHCGAADATGLLDLAAWRKHLAGQHWRDSLFKVQDDQELSAVRLCTSRGGPLGEDGFLERLEGLIGHRVRALPRGRPKAGK